MRIEKYELTKKSKYNVFLSNGEVITLDERVITENELLLKKDLDINLYNKVIREGKIYELVDTAIKYISIRLRSIKETREYLRKKEEDEELIEVSIEKLIKFGYLDDNKFAKAFVKDKMTFTSMGDYKIRMELQNFGVANEIIEENISQIEEKILVEKMKKQIEKYLRTNKKYSGLVLKNKIYIHLVTAGFTKEKVLSVLSDYTF